MAAHDAWQCMARHVAAALGMAVHGLVGRGSSTGERMAVHGAWQRMAAHGAAHGAWRGRMAAALSMHVDAWCMAAHGDTHGRCLLHACHAPPQRAPNKPCMLVSPDPGSNCGRPSSTARGTQFHPCRLAHNPHAKMAQTGADRELGGWRFGHGRGAGRGGPAVTITGRARSNRGPLRAVIAGRRETKPSRRENIRPKKPSAGCTAAPRSGIPSPPPAACGRDCPHR
eukprot:351347-Chlamydomonas_euryale.AAC.4